jgi:hypothetical protein
VTVIDLEAEALAEGWRLSRHVAEQAGITYRKLDYWTRLGHLRPEHDGGSGYDRCWPPEEVQVACRIARLTDAGLPLAIAAGFARDHWPCGEIAPGVGLSVTG